MELRLLRVVDGHNLNLHSTLARSDRRHMLGRLMSARNTSQSLHRIYLLHIYSSRAVWKCPKEWRLLFLLLFLETFVNSDRHPRVQ